MNRDSIPPAILELFAGLEDSPNEAVQRFAGLSRWGRHKRARMTPERMREELGRAYREEVARVLGEWAGLVLFEDPACKDLFHRSVRVGETLVQLTATQWNEDADGILALSESHEGIAGEIAMLESLRHGKNPNRLQVVLLAWRLCPMDRLGLQAAIEYGLRREWESSTRFLSVVRGEPSSCLNLSCAWESEGANQIAQGRLGEAFEALQNASLCGEDRPAPATSWLIVSLHLGDRRGAELAATRLTELSPKFEEVIPVLRCFRALRDRALFEVRINTEAARWAQARGDLVRRTIDALS